jgi:enoyl-CoA hydratase
MVAENSTKFTRIIYEKRDHVAWITLNRPEVRNAQNSGLRDELVSALELGRDDEDVHMMVITGAGEAFCAGGDIKAFPATPVEFMEKYGRQITGKKRPIELVREIPKPIIAMVNGLALGAGCEIAIACDIIIASEDAQFGQPEIRVGLIPGGGGTQVLPRLVGEKRAKELIFTGNSISAEEAQRIGIVNKVVPKEKLKEVTEEFVSVLLKRSPLALKFAKMSINKSLETSLSVGLAYEVDLCAICIGTEDLKEGAMAFKEKRPPVYRGK